MKTNYSWIMLSVSCLCFFSPSYTQYQLSPLAPQLMSQYNLSMGQFTSLFSAPMIPAIFSSLVAGLFADKLGLKKVIGLALAISTLGSCWRVIADDNNTLMISMILSGFGAAFLNANGAKIVSTYFPAAKISPLMSLLLASTTLAMILGMGTTGLFPDITTAFLFAAILSALATLLWFFVIKSPLETRIANSSIPSLGISLQVVMKSKVVWIVGFSLMGLTACNVAISSFLPTTLIERGMGEFTAGIYSSIMMTGSLFGCLFFPMVANKIGKTKPFILSLSLVSAIGAGFAWNAPTGAILGASLFLTGSALNGLMPILMSIPIRLPEIGPLYAGTSGGFTSTLQLLGGVIIPSFVITPIAGANMMLYYILSGFCMLAVAGLGILIPELGVESIEILSKSEIV
jgi:NNP family nitrate/nitrite transporter-like MFS transporter